MRQVVKSLGSLSHRAAARNAYVAAYYLRLFRALKLMPDGSWKAFVFNSLQSVEWPDVALPRTKVCLAPGIEVAITPHLGEFDFAAHIYRRLNYERETVSWFAGRRYDTIIEIGANVGFYTLLFSRLFPEASVYAFEPSRIAYERLVENLAANDCRNVFPFNCAVAAEAGFVDFYEPVGHLTNGSLDRSFATAFAEDIQATKVASMTGVQIQGLCPGGRRWLLKIDAEGAEPAIVRTLESIITSKLPDIVIEVLPAVAPELAGMDCFRAYRCFHLRADGPREKDGFTSAFECGRDYALVPR
jgi:FkbM family methyltransferase